MAVLRAPAIKPRAPSSPSIGPQVRLFSRAEYDRMVGLGFFEGERLELLEGMLVEMSPQEAPHSSTVSKLNELLVVLLKGRFKVRPQLPLALSADSEPEPDIAIVAPGSYDAAHPTTALLVIEVADSSMRKDRAKAAIYARAGIPAYWIVNLDTRCIELYSSPDGDRYAEAHTLRANDTARSPTLEFAFAVADILPAT